MAQPLGGVIGIGGGTYPGALEAADRLATRGVRGLISFGLAGGLDPMLAPGSLVVPGAILVGTQRYPTDPGLSARMGGADGRVLLGGDAVVADVAAKAALWRGTGAAAVDLESGAVAEVATRYGLPFAALRAVCDPATRSLPPAALLALDQQTGGIGLGRVIGSLLHDPGQIPALLALAWDARAARRALIARARSLPAFSGEILA